MVVFCVLGVSTRPAAAGTKRVDLSIPLLAKPRKLAEHGAEASSRTCRRMRPAAVMVRRAHHEAANIAPALIPRLEGWRREAGSFSILLSPPFVMAGEDPALLTPHPAERVRNRRPGTRLAAFQTSSRARPRVRRARIS
jgi:hypothetical protein